MISSHPKGLQVLFFTEMWERFSYYGMRALLVLYLTSQIIHGGFEFTREHALEIYGIFTGLVYLAPLFGGFMADKVLGQRKSIYIGAILMAIGQFSLAISQIGNIEMRTYWLIWGLGVLIVGNGFFKPNISSMVGKLYADNDPRKDSAFTIFYMGINIGAFFSPIVAGGIGEAFGWGYGFAIAGFGMLLGLAWFYFQSHHIEGAGLPPQRVYDPSKRWQLIARDRIDITAYVVGLAILVYAFLTVWSMIGDTTKTISLTVLAIGGTLGLISLIVANTKGKQEWKRVFVIIVLCLFNIFFFAGFEQAGGTFNLFAAENTNLSAFFGKIPASLFQAVNPVFIIILAPLFSILWIWFAKRDKEPSIPVKFGLAMLFLALGFWVMNMAFVHSSGGFLVSPFWLIGVYLLHTIGELMLSPIGLSMISQLAPQKIVSVMMGFWFACTAMAQYLAGVLESILHNYLPALPLFSFLTLTSLGACITLLLLSPFLSKMMK